ncbi:hypothetical protein [Actinosynnema pretiosum]|nr:hypothetical protein [Actinosynnema pretiosum]
MGLIRGRRAGGRGSGAPHGFDALVPDSPVTRDFLARARSWSGER